jgi:3-phytase
MKLLKLSLVFILVSIIACNSSSQIKESSSIEKFYSSLDSSSFSVYLGKTIEKQKIFTQFITVDIETDEVLSEPGIDAADDPAIWVNTENPEKSLVLGTNKKGGIHVFDINGIEQQYVKAGCMNNIDLRDDFEYDGRNVVLVAASNCTNNSISFFYIDKKTNLLSDTILNIKSSVELIYGMCMYKSSLSNKFYVFANGERAEVEQWEISSEGDKIKADLVREFKVSSRPEGMVADDIDGVLYIGVEEEGILKVKAEPEYEFETKWVTGSNLTDRSLVSSDIEGLALYKTQEKTYLIASSQGNFSYAIFEIGENDKHLLSFVIKDSGIDGVEETDGIEVVNFPFNDKFPNGMLVVHDGYNFSGDTLRNQNFKYISWDKIYQMIQNQ